MSLRPSLYIAVSGHGLQGVSKGSSICSSASGTDHLSPRPSLSHGPSPRRRSLADAPLQPPLLWDCCYQHSVYLVFLLTVLQVPLGYDERGKTICLRRLQTCPSPWFCKVAPEYPSFVSRAHLHVSMHLCAR